MFYLGMYAGAGLVVGIVMMLGLRVNRVPRSQVIPMVILGAVFWPLSVLAVVLR
jgi:hypothetical protein